MTESNHSGPGLLVFDMSYTLHMFRQRQLDHALDSRRLGGYFARVISVHPLAGLFDAGHTRFGPPIVTDIDASHVFVEGRIGRTKWLRFIPPLNFLFAQVSLMQMLLRLARRQRI